MNTMYCSTCLGLDDESSDCETCHGAGRVIDDETGRDAQLER